MTNTVETLEIPGVTKLKSGKVREVFDLDDVLLFVATDRLSAFDVILPNPIPEKGRVLSQLSQFWFERTTGIVPNHMVTMSIPRIMGYLGRENGGLRTLLSGRSMIVRKCKPLPVECVVRGYLYGSAWKEYKHGEREICGIRLPDGLVEASLLSEPIFTATTKAETGHDENLTFEQVCHLIGPATAEFVRRVSIELYKFAADYARQRGIIIADTKFEFGIDSDGNIVLIDEALTPDSSRFWPADQYQPGRSQPSFDKQFVRDYLESIGWGKKPPAPTLPTEIITGTTQKYLEALARLTAASN